MTPHEARLRLTNEIPVRVTGYIEDRVFTIEAVMIDFAKDQSFDIIDSLAPAVIERLEEEANEQIEGQLTR